MHLVRSVYLPGYHRTLVDGGVSDYEYERFFSDYRFGVIDTLQHVVGVVAVVDFAREDALDLVRLIVGRVAASAVDAGCGELVP